MSRRTAEDLIFPERVFFQMIGDYSEGRLSNTRNRLFHRAVVVDVDTVGGQLESHPPNPPGSVRARVYSDGMDATTPHSALTIFHPLFPAHVRAPVERDEHILVIFEDSETLSNGLWVTTVGAYRNINFRDPEENRTPQRNSSDVFENTHSQPTEVNRDVEFGGLSEESGIREEIISSFESSNESIFKNKKILLLGDGYVASSFGSEFGVLVQGRGAIRYASEGRDGWGVAAWNRGKLTDGSRGPTLPGVQQLIENNRPDLIFISLGVNDFSDEDYSTKVSELWDAANSSVLTFWIGPPTLVGPSSTRMGRVNSVISTIKQVVGSNFIDSRDITNANGRHSNGIQFTDQGGKDWAQLMVNRIERSF